MAANDPPADTVLSMIRADAASYAEYGGWLRNVGFWLTVIYRFGMWADSLPTLLRWHMWLVYRVFHLPYWLFNVHLWAGKRGAKMGPGLCLIHSNNIYIGPGVSIGKNCLIHHEVTLGMGNLPGTPQIGDNVTLYPGARLLGGVRIGNDTMIGANCVIVRHLPPGSIVMPAANRILPRALSPQARKLDAAAGPSTTPPGD